MAVLRYVCAVYKKLLVCFDKLSCVFGGNVGFIVIMRAQKNDRD
jgi:hypothetical protein